MDPSDELIEKLSNAILTGHIRLTQRELAEVLPVLLASHRQRQTPAWKVVTERYQDDVNNASLLLFRELKSQTREAIDLLGQLIMGMTDLERLGAARNRVLVRRLLAVVEDSMAQERATLPRRQPGRRRRPRRREHTYELRECPDCLYPLDYDPDDDACVPPVDDDLEWEALARDHAEGCPWVDTRAHRRPR